MNKFEAIKILNLTGDINQDLIKQAYRKACTKFHPYRNPAGIEIMKLLNQAFETLKKEPDFAAENKTEGYDESLNDAINAVMQMDGVIIEICGLWVWLSGDTRPHKTEIKEAGYFWASKKMMWYFRPADFKSKGRGKDSIDDIRAKYGSKEVKTTNRTKIR
jgi:curved DNA-binding protein CbpA